MQKNTRQVIFNGDDFGLSHGVNKGIIEAIRRGVLTSTSVMVDGPAAGEAGCLSHLKDVSIGLHVDMIGESRNKWLAYLSLFKIPKERIRKEFLRQVSKFCNLMGRLPDHIDGHYHIHLHPRVKSIVREFATKYKIPVRGLSQVKFVRRFGAIGLTKKGRLRKVSPGSLIRILSKLKPGTYEIMCHPARVDNGLIESGDGYVEARERELTTLMAPDIRNFIVKTKNISLISWKDSKAVYS